MVNKITKKAILKIKETVDAYGKEMAVINEKIATIDEKYRKLAEKETKELKAAYADLEAEQEIWNTSLSSYDAEIVNEVLGGDAVSATEEPEPVVEETPTVDETPEVVVDTLFEENNDENSEEPEEEPVEEETEEEEPESEESDVIWPEEETQQETPVEESPVKEASGVEESILDTDDWPVEPEEWV